HGPSRLGFKAGNIQASFFLEFSRDAQIEIDLVADDIIWIGRATRKIDFPRIECMRAHDGEQIGTVRRPYCRRAEAIPYARSRTTPMAPGGKARIVGFQILTAKYAPFDDLAMHQQDATIPEFRFLTPQRFEIGVNLGATRDCKGPGPWRE